MIDPENTIVSIALAYANFCLPLWAVTECTDIDLINAAEDDG